MRLLVTGSRFWDDYDVFTFALTVATQELKDGDKEIIIVHGKANKGADEMCEEYVNRTKQYFSGHGISIRTEPHPAQWNVHENCKCLPNAKYCRAAGPRRNHQMADLGADICVAFFKKGEKNNGTRDCSDYAASKGIRVLKYTD